MTDLSAYREWLPPDQGYALAPAGFFPARVELRQLPPIEVELAECCMCHEDLPLDAFPRNASQSSGRDYICRECRNAYRRQKRADERADQGLPPRTRRRPNPSEQRPPKPPKPPPRAMAAVPDPDPPSAVTEIPRKTLKDRLAERRSAAS
jgi:hypothetical protein